MADKELRKLSRRELLKMLLIQCEETERLQNETDQMREQMATVMESYERLKQKLNVKDERLNQKDAKIAELKRMISQMHESEAVEADSIADITHKLNEVLAEAQKAVDQYIARVRRMNTTQNLFEAEMLAGIRRRPASRGGQVVPMTIGQTAGTDRRTAGVAKTLGMNAAASGDI